MKFCFSFLLLEPFTQQDLICIPFTRQALPRTLGFLWIPRCNSHLAFPVQQKPLEFKAELLVGRFRRCVRLHDHLLLSIEVILPGSNFQPSPPPQPDKKKANMLYRLLTHFQLP
ncbi:hypothetical protein B0H16DRAFT_1496633 [Mycena metata]|uniref:Uncharacterized protein n=1 Tax=Mycena metata TaxID=1033252 RepID=A0AAD7NYA0_9AGAR|nr:hypothetical protein B0H16DRAFT_1496633 [Mycena metata]